MIIWNEAQYYMETTISSILIMIGLFFLISEKTKHKIYGVLFLSVGIGVISHLIVFLLLFIIEQNFSISHMLMNINVNISTI